MPRNLLLAVVALGFISGKAYSYSSQALAEWAPLKGLGGETSLALEKYFNPYLGLQALYDTYSWQGERDNFTDKGQKIFLGAVVRPQLPAFPGLFVGMGAVYETARIGRQRRRDGTTWIRTQSDELYDLWVNKDRYFGMAQCLGYRWVFAEWMTASIRLIVDEVLWWDSEEKTDSIYSREFDLSSRGRDPVQKSVMFHAGVAIP